jgi:hypothetical protein
MRENAARKIMSGWSALRLGMTRPELTVIGIGEWDRPTGNSDWGVIIRDLRTDEGRLVFSEDEWKTINRRGLPPVGVDWGEPLPAVSDQPAAPTEMDAEWADYKATQAIIDATDRSMSDILGYLEFDLGEELAKDQDFTPFTHEQVSVIGEAIRRGTPEKTRLELKQDRVELRLDALIEWLRVQRHANIDSPDLTAILNGKVDIDISGDEPRFAKHDSGSESP